MVTEEQVIEALKGVRFPGLSRDIVSFGFVRDLSVDESSNVSFVLKFQTENPEVGKQITHEAEAAVKKLPGVGHVAVVTDVSQRTQPAAPQTPTLRALENVRYKIAVASGKGGVGKSTVSTNLAIALHKLGYKVGLLDADIYGPSQQMMLGIEGRPVIDDEEKIVPPERHGIKTMSLGLITDPDTPVIWRGPMVMKALEQFLGDVRWGELDYMIIDLPPGTGDAQLTLTQRVPLNGAVVVTTPQDVALIDARKALAMFRKVNVPVLGIVENMSYFICKHCGEREEIFGHGGGKKTAALLGVPFLGEVPIDPQIVIGGDTGEPIVASDAGAAASEAFLQLGNYVVKEMQQRHG